MRGRRCPRQAPRIPLAVTTAPRDPVLAGRAAPAGGTQQGQRLHGPKEPSSTPWPCPSTILHRSRGAAAGPAPSPGALPARREGLGPPAAPPAGLKAKAAQSRPSQASSRCLFSSRFLSVGTNWVNPEPPPPPSCPGLFPGVRREPRQRRERLPGAELTPSLLQLPALGVPLGSGLGAAHPQGADHQAPCQGGRRFGALLGRLQVVWGRAEGASAWAHSQGAGTAPSPARAPG